jgi:DNA invertase Pin-like site-specific DNA recombinase
MKYGYARVSTDDQNPALQTEALRAAGCDKIFTDHGVSGTRFKRPQLDRCLKALKSGDTLVVWKMDRLARSVLHLLQLVGEFQERKVHFQSLTEELDAATPYGRAFLQMRGMFAELERNLIVERTRAGRAAAVKRGVRFGPKPKVTPTDLRDAQEMLTETDADGSMKYTFAAVADRIRVHRVTLRRALNRVASN